jgi:phenylacetate-CoA ligase
MDAFMNRSLEQSIHRAAYLTLQRLRGRPVGPFIEQLRRRERLDRAAFERLNEEELEAMLEYAKANVPLYSTGPWARAEASDLSTWPVLERHTVRTRGKELLSRRPRLGTFYRRSSASTGEPLRVAWNPHAAAWGWANEYRVMLWHGLAPGARTLLLWGSRHRLQDWIRNCRGFLTTELTPERLEEAAQYVLRRRPQLCMGLPSALTMLARHIRAKHPDAPHPLVPFVKLGGEQVYPFQRQELERHFGARVVEFYGCTEVGPIAAQCPAGSMHIMADNVRVEIFKEGEPARPGEFGDIVVTTLSNRAMPLIRCRIGDSGRLSPEPCSCGLPHPVLQDLIGRAADVFVAADGRTVHGSVLGRELSTILAGTPVGVVRQVSFEQIHPMRWKVWVESDGGFDQGLASRVADVVRAHFGARCEVELERVPVVPREPSGKFRYYLPVSRAPFRPSEAQHARTREDRVKMI